MTSDVSTGFWVQFLVRTKLSKGGKPSETGVNPLAGIIGIDKASKTKVILRFVCVQKDPKRCGNFAKLACSLHSSHRLARSSVLNLSIVSISLETTIKIR